MNNRQEKLLTFHKAQFLVRNWLVSKYYESLLEPTAFVIDDKEYRICFARLKDFTGYLIALNIDILLVMQECSQRAWIHDFLIDVRAEKVKNSAFLQTLTSSLQLGYGRNRVIGITEMIFQEVPAKAPAGSANAQQEPYQTLIRMQASGKSVSDVLQYLRSADGRQLLKLCQSELARHPKTRGTIRTPSRERRLQDLVEAAFSTKYYKRMARPKPSAPILPTIHWIPPVLIDGVQHIDRPAVQSPPACGLQD